ncbi:hypothetical protein [Pantoea sp.]|uniref:hypothetical protein n=1 Tax=Pantoea sp. TaxID=69393 RepID=UPI0031DDC703
MKKLLALSLACISLQAFAQTPAKPKPFFDSKSFQVFLDTRSCLEGDVECDGIVYHSINKKNHHELTLKGSTLNIGPSHDFRGYIFRNGDYSYVLSPAQGAGNYDNHVWTLQVSQHQPQGDVVLFSENGNVSE